MDNNTIKVLLVDDEAELVNSLRKRLLRRGFIAVGVHSGPEAVYVVKQRSFDVAVVDLKMPGMDGLQVLEQLKTLQPMLKSIILTGHGSIDAAHQSGRLEAIKFLTKPADFGQLIELIETAYQEKRRAQRAAYNRELTKVISSRPTPHEMMAATTRLRAQYEQ